MKATDGTRSGETEPETPGGYEHLLTSLSEHMTSGDREVGRWIQSACEPVLSRLAGLSAVLAPPASLRIASLWGINNLRSVTAIIGRSYTITQSDLSLSALCIACTLAVSWVCWLWRQSWLGVWWHIIFFIILNSSNGVNVIIHAIRGLITLGHTMMTLGNWFLYPVVAYLLYEKVRRPLKRPLE